MKEKISTYEMHQRLMQERPVNLQSNARSPFSDTATVPVPLTKERYKKLKQERNAYRYTKGKQPRAHKISLRKYNKQAREQDNRVKGERFGT